MTDTSIVTARLDRTLNERLDALARSTQRSKSFLIAEAVAAYVEVNAWQVEGIQQALDEIEAGAAGVPQEDVEAWVRSWGTENELPMPRSRS